MLIFWEPALVFLATPKAGSTAVQTALEPLASVASNRPEPLKHMSALDYQTWLAPFLNRKRQQNFTTVALMRHPVEWLRSWYRFRTMDDFDNPAHPMQGRTFDQFALDYISGNAPEVINFTSQADFLTDASGKCIVDHLFRYEDIGLFIRFLEDRLKCEITLPRINVPLSADTHLSEPVREKLTHAMAADFTLYDTITTTPSSV